jgi:hypothetical protein
MIPAIGTRDAPFQGTAPERKITVRTGTTPHPIATATHGQARGASIRREDVKTATPNMKTANTKDQTSWLRTAVITNETTASCTTARTAGAAMERSTFNRPPTSGDGQHDQDHRARQQAAIPADGSQLVSADDETANQPSAAKPEPYDVAYRDEAVISNLQAPLTGCRPSSSSMITPAADAFLPQVDSNLRPTD